MPYYDGNFQTAVQNGPSEIEYPFQSEGDNKTKILRRTMWQQSATHSPLRLNTRDSEYVGLYLVEESPPTPLIGGIVEFVRTYSAIPQVRTTSEPYAWTRPGANVSGASSVIPAIFESAAVGGLFVGVSITAVSHGLAPGDSCNLRLGQFDNPSTVNSVNSVDSLVLTWDQAPGVLRAYFLRRWEYGPPFTESASLITSKNAANYSPRTLVVPGNVEHSYYLPGITPGISRPEDIPVLQRWSVLGPTGASEVDTLQANTLPTLAQYRTMVASRDRVVAEPSFVGRWMGNIYERRTILVTVV